MDALHVLADALPRLQAAAVLLWVAGTAGSLASAALPALRPALAYGRLAGGDRRAAAATEQPLIGALSALLVVSARRVCGGRVLRPCEGATRARH